MVVSATSIFGDGAGSADSIFAAGKGGGATDAQIAAQTVVNASKQEINRIRGYKPLLTPADNKRLADIQTEITKLNEKASNGTLRADEVEDRAALFLEADTIIGKPSANVENDDFLDGIREKIDDLLAPRLTPPQERRLETLNTLLAGFEERLAEDSSNVIAIRQVQNIQKQIANIDVPRLVSQLSVSEKQEYDSLVEQANEHAGAKLLLNAQESVRVQNLEETIERVSGSLPPSAAGQPTSASVARAYARFL
jgi:hypothetical protein